MSTRHRTAAIGLALCLTAGCGVSGGDEGASTTTSEQPSTTTSTAPTTTTTAPTTTTTETSDDADQALVDASAATLDATAFSIDSLLDVSVGPQSFSLAIEGSVDYDAGVAGITLSVSGDGQAGEVEIRSDATNIWIRPEGSAAGDAIPGGKTWVEGSADRLDESDNFDQAGLLGVLIALRAAEDTERTGTDEIDGTEVTTYETTIDYAEAVKAAGDHEEAFTTALGLKAPGTVTLEGEVAVGSDGVIRHVALDVKSDPDLVDGTYELDLSDVGATIDPPKAPPAEKTLTGPKAEELLDQLID